MPIWLARRDAGTRELMDEPDCDPERLANTYRQFRTVNLISRAGWIYRRRIRPAMTQREQAYSLLDVGFGGGDIALKIARWARRDGYNLHVTGIEIDARAYEYVRALDWPENVSFRLADIHDLAERGECFDFVISNHMLHHLDRRALKAMLEATALLCSRFVLFIDLRRSDLAYILFAAAATLLFRKSYIRHDGLSSIRRSYTFRELEALAPLGWKVKRLFPFRLTLSYCKPPAQ